MTGVPEDKTSSGSGFVTGGKWWRTVSPLELRVSPEVVDAFLQGAGGIDPEDIEAFARALALQQLFGDREAVWEAAYKASDLMPATPSRGVAHEAVSQAEAWLPRGRAIAAGLMRSLELLKPQGKAEWEAAVNRFHLGFGILKSSCVDAAVHGGLRSPLAVSKPRSPRPRKV